jgi:hypothetical protein
MSSRGRFAKLADFPRHDCSPYSHLQVLRESLGFVHRSRTISCRPVPNRSVTIRFFIAVSRWVVASHPPQFFILPRSPIKAPSPRRHHRWGKNNTGCSQAEAHLHERLLEVLALHHLFLHQIPGAARLTPRPLRLDRLVLHLLVRLRQYSPHPVLELVSIIVLILWRSLSSRSLLCSPSTTAHSPTLPRLNALESRRDHPLFKCRNIAN